MLFKLIYLELISRNSKITLELKFSKFAHVLLKINFTLCQNTDQKFRIVVLKNWPKMISNWTW